MGESALLVDMARRSRRLRHVQAGLLSLWEALLRLPGRLDERGFWITQAGIALITGLHYGAEIIFNGPPFWTLHHIPVILYIIPIAYASIKYSWEGGLLTSAWVALLVLPSILLWHKESLMWLAETARLVIVVGVGVTLASRVEAESRARRQAEAVSARLALSEVRFRTLFEAAGDAILVFDRHGYVVAANAAATTFFGATDSTSLLRQHIHALAPSWTTLPPSDESNPGNSVKGPTRVTIRRGDGRDLLAEAVITAVPSSGEEETFQAVLRDATAQETREKGLRFLVHQTTRAQEEERERIARELHDDTLQALILMAREIECLSDAPEISGTTQARLGKMAELATKTGEDLRRFSRDLRPSILKDLGLVPAIEWLTADLSQRAGLKASFHVEGETRRLPGHAELALFRIAQESLRNVEKHAQATGVDIVLGFHPAQVLLNIRDNGTGFMAPSALDELVLTGKLGLVGLKERALLVGGALEVRSAPGQGTEVAVTIPG